MATPKRHHRQQQRSLHHTHAVTSIAAFLRHGHINLSTATCAGRGIVRPPGKVPPQHGGGQSGAWKLMRSYHTYKLAIGFHTEICECLLLIHLKNMSEGCLMFPCQAAHGSRHDRLYWWETTLGRHYSNWRDVMQRCSTGEEMGSKQGWITWIRSSHFAMQHGGRWDPL